MRKLTIFFLILLSISRIDSQEVSAKLTPSVVQIGDYLHLELSYKNKGYTNTLFPQINDTSIGNFRFVELKKVDTSFSGSDVIIRHHYIVTCFEDSVQTFPSLIFYNGTLAPYITTPITITVKSPKLDSAADIKPIKDIIIVPLSKEEVYQYLFISIILLIGILILYFVYIKFIRKENLFDRSKPIDPPHVAALQSLKVVETENLWQMGKIKEFYDRISDILREYIEKRFGLKAMEQTTNELLKNMHEMNLPDYVIRDMEEILTKSDLAKFAKEKHEGEQHLSILKMAYQFIQSTQITNDINKISNALHVRKFYAQNKYGYKTIAINQYSFKIVLFGLISTLLILSAAIAISYMIPINYILGLLANNSYMFFVWFILFGVIVTFIILYFLRLKMVSYLLIFDYNSVIIRENGKQKSILFKQIDSSEVDKKGNLIVMDNSKNKITISKNIEYFDEVRERISDVSGLE